MSGDVTIANKAVGVLGIVQINSIDFQLTKCTFKLEGQKINYTPMGQGGFRYQIPGGEKFASGSFEGVADTVLNAATTLANSNGQGIAPFNDSLVDFLLPFESGNATTVTLAFKAYISDVEIEKDSSGGAVKIKGSYESSGLITVS